MTLAPYNWCQVTLGTPSGTDQVAPGDEVTFYVESTLPNTPVTGGVTITPSVGNAATKPLGSGGPAMTDSGGRASYRWTIDQSAVIGTGIHFAVTVGGVSCSADASVD